MKNQWIKPVKRVSLREHIYSVLKRAIINLELKPGEVLRDQVIAEQFEVSRTPVREALKRLEDEGLIETFPGAITRVTLIKEEESQHILQVLGTLHTLATRLALPVMTSDNLKAMQDFNQQLLLCIKNKDARGAIDADSAFHQVILNAANNPEIISCLELMTPKIQRVELVKFQSIDSLLSVDQHQEIIDAIADRNEKQAVKVMEENWSILNALLSKDMPPSSP
ncbi:DNA-binding GntR family transcriptional regulator [Pullulanibacillus pueri]|uniref:GntR family transcriptional regulator n=1 Tax=Pullulanibacillus pueri TaxID=1437324 RepID=A0A8J2ZR45_9BACL|nr:GntR family transcriptional regulator [Pullulanibacillus pueri]MBM7680004.1 DNA-binding GntR family transcriptional regulator [Pullulanibacillus pueri]GGH73890.1 GntR family transcriptional regulator [Pullulanibacillus pueri]